MKQGWEVKKLGEVCDFKSGTTIPVALERENGNVLYVKVADMNLPENIVEINTSSRFVDVEEINIKQLIPESSIVFPKRGGAIATNKKRKIVKPTIVDLNIMAVIPNDKVESNYLFFWFQGLDLNKISNGTSIPQINNYSFDNVFISYPKSLQEQQRIVSILDKAFADIDKLKENTEKNLKNAREVFESYLQSVFDPSTRSGQEGEDWEEKKLGDIADIKGGKRIPKGKKLQTAMTEYPYIRVTDFNDNGSIDLNSIQYINKEIYEQIKNYTISNKDVYISIAGTIGKSGIIPIELEGANLTENACKLIIKDEIDKNIIYYFTISKSFQNQAGLNTRTTAMPKLALARLATIKISFPKSIEKQKEIVKKLDELQAETKRLEEIYQQKLNSLEELKQAILHKAFNGEL